MRQTHTRRCFMVGNRYGYVASISFAPPAIKAPGDMMDDDPYLCANCPNEIYEGRLCECCQSDAR